MTQGDGRTTAVHSVYSRGLARAVVGRLVRIAREKSTMMLVERWYSLGPKVEESRVDEVCVVFTLNRPSYPASSVHPVSVLTSYPRDILVMWSETETRRRQKTTVFFFIFLSKPGETPAYRVREAQQHKQDQKMKTKRQQSKRI